MIVCPDVKWMHHNQEKEGYYLDGLIVQLDEAIAKRVNDREQDCLIIMDGREGSGKTNAAVCMAKHIANLTGRKFDVGNIYFELEKLMKDAGNSKEQIYIWDEATLGGLAADWKNDMQVKLVSLLMICRKKRHVFIFNIPRFFRLTSKIIERALGLLHMYENDREEPGNFMWIGSESLEDMYYEWRKKQIANYVSYKKFFGKFAYHIKNIIDYETYDAAKDKAIKDLVDKANFKKVSMAQKRLDILRVRMTNYFKRQGKTEDEIAELMGVHSNTVGRARLRAPDTPNFYKTYPLQNDDSGGNGEGVVVGKIEKKDEWDINMLEKPEE